MTTATHYWESQARMGSPEKLFGLVEVSGDWRVLSVVASRPDCPEKLLLRLANHESDAVRINAARNPQANKDVLWTILSKDSCECVRTALAENLSLSKDRLEILKQERDPDIRRAAYNNQSQRSK